jgi:hypothetical protein
VCWCIEVRTAGLFAVALVGDMTDAGCVDGAEKLGVFVVGDSVGWLLVVS